MQKLRFRFTLLQPSAYYTQYNIELHPGGEEGYIPWPCTYVTDMRRPCGVATPDKLINVRMHVIYEYKVLLEIMECVCQGGTDQSSCTDQYSEMNISRNPSGSTAHYRRPHEDFLQSLECIICSFAR